MNTTNIHIRSFEKADQDVAKALINQGLGEHFGWIDESTNPDLDDIAASFAYGLFLTAWYNDNLIGTGGVIPEDDGMYRVVRMSVDLSYRRCGIGTKILDKLVEYVQSRGCRRIVLETTSTWDNVIAFYQHYGFSITHTATGNTHFVLDV